MRESLKTVASPANRIGLGRALSDLSRRVGLTNADLEALARTNDHKPAQPVSVE